MDATYFNQSQFTVRCEWGAHGIAALGPESDVMIIVDVLSFSTCVDVAVGNGALIYPYPWKDASAERFATSKPAILASSRGSDPGELFPFPRLAPRVIPAGTRLVLPSPNGATSATPPEPHRRSAGCLRNARAVAQAAQTIGQRISVIAAGERWPDGSLRPAIEDWVGAGAIIAHLAGRRSPEAEVAFRAFEHVQSDLAWYLAECSSGRELDRARLCRGCVPSPPR